MTDNIFQMETTTLAHRTLDPIQRDHRHSITPEMTTFPVSTCSKLQVEHMSPSRVSDHSWKSVSLVLTCEVALCQIPRAHMSRHHGLNLHCETLSRRTHCIVQTSLWPTIIILPTRTAMKTLWTRRTEWVSCAPECAKTQMLCEYVCDVFTCLSCPSRRSLQEPHQA